MSDTLEKIKIELRSILLSSKHGVVVADIQSDYEQLLCQRLPYKELGFPDVPSLMRAMPDVAREVRSQGQITYHAVCDESTAHIQKLVSNQTTKKKRGKLISRGRGSGRRGCSRGSFRGRDGHVSSTRGGLLGDTPRFPYATKGPRPVRFNSASLRGSFSSGNNRGEPYNNRLRDDQIKKGILTPPRDVRATEPSSFSSNVNSNDCQHISSGMYNLKIGVSQSGRRVISDSGTPLGKSRDSNDDSADESVPASRIPTDLRDLLNKRRAHQAEDRNHEEDDWDADGNGVKTDILKTKRVMTENQHIFKKNLPPRLQRQQSQQGPVAQERQALLPVPVPPDPQLVFSEKNTIYTTEKRNCIPPEDGPRYLQTFVNYFAQRGEEAPEITVDPGKFNQLKGYYGRLTHLNKHYYPLEIMQTDQHARQNVARSFCLENAIPLMPAEQHDDKPIQNQPSSSISHSSQRVQQARNIIELRQTESLADVKPLHMSHQHKLSNSGPVITPAWGQHGLPETLEKIYKILKPNGIWVSMIPNLYEETYGQTLNMDFVMQASQWPDYFTLEELAGKRITVYPVPNALTKEPVVNDVKINEDKISSVPVPPTLLPSVRSKTQVLFSYAYSADNMYFQSLDKENLVYEIEEMLNSSCPGTPAPELEALTVSSLVAATYENSWYRAQIVAVESAMVTVYFIDYGNREKVNISDLRPIPHHNLTLNTPSLAINCAVRKTKVGNWCEDVTARITELCEVHSVLSIMVLEHRDDQCIVDLFTPEDSLVNDMLIQPAPTTPLQQEKSQCKRTELVEGDIRKLSKTVSPGLATKLFADDPEPLVIPDCDSFGVYVCRVMSENTVLLRIVEEEYSDKLDDLEHQIAENFYSWPMPKTLKRSNIYAGMVLAGADDDVESDEEGTEKLSDKNKYHRVRLLKEIDNVSCECYLPDHGHDEILNCSQLREIDSDLNLSLSYQAVMAKLHGLDKLPDNLKPMTVRILIKLLTNGSTYYAVKKGNVAENKKDTLAGVDTNIMSRVRKIISCVRDVQPANVAKIYQEVYKESITNVEEIIKNIPGFGYWRESLEVELYDTSQEEGDININAWIVTSIEEMDKVQSQGGDVENVWRNLFSSNASQGDTPDNGSVQEEHNEDSLSDVVLNKLDTDRNGFDDEAKLSRVQGYVEDLKSPTQNDITKPATNKVLYTWNTKPETQNAAASLFHTPTTSLPSASPKLICDNFCLPKFWSYPLLKFVSLQIIRVENPSCFVTIPVEQRGALEKLEVAIAQYFSTHSAEPATSYSSEVLYAMKSNVVYRRTLYINRLADMVKVFFPDHHSYDTVHPSELFLLPQQFYSLPFLAHRSRLGGVVPIGQDWPTDVTQWFKDAVNNKCMYALVTAEEHSNSSDPRIPKTLVVGLIDTSGPEDLVIEEYMESQGMAERDPNDV